MDEDDLDTPEDDSNKDEANTTSEEQVEDKPTSGMLELLQTHHTSTVPVHR
jgi:hypothetical protein